MRRHEGAHTSRKSDQVFQCEILSPFGRVNELGEILNNLVSNTESNKSSQKKKEKKKKKGKKKASYREKKSGAGKTLTHVALAALTPLVLAVCHLAVY